MEIGVPEKNSGVAQNTSKKQCMLMYVDIILKGACFTD
jgi:hypothetical protein